MLIYFGKNVSEKIIVTEIQRKSPLVSHSGQCRQAEAMNKAHSLRVDAEGLPDTKIRGKFRRKKIMSNEWLEERVNEKAKERRN